MDHNPGQSEDKEKNREGRIYFRIKECYLILDLEKKWKDKWT